MQASATTLPARRRIGLVTCAKVPDLTPDDRRLAAELERRGVEAVPVLWDDEAADWDAFDSVVLRSCWDYHRRLPEFAAWLDRLEAHCTRVWNPLPLVRWNLHKSYLADLERAGTPIVPTVWLARGAEVRLADVVAERGWPRAVVKPAVSASAYETWVVGDADAAASQERLEALLAGSDVLVQRFEPAIGEQGEWSILFLGGRYSHAVLKRPGAGDFRVQEELGGSSTPAEPPSPLVEQCREILARLPEPTLYARVDGLDLAGTFTLMELELIEPVLFLGTHPLAARRMADALLTG